MPVDSSGARWLIVLDPPKYLYYRPSEVERLAILRGSLRRPLTVAHRFEKGTVYRIE